MSDHPFNDIWKKQHGKLVRATFKKAIITNVNVSANTADVYFSENPATVIRSIPLASQIIASQVMVGDRCRIDVFDETNPNDMVVAYIYGRVLTPLTIGVSKFYSGQVIACTSKGVFPAGWSVSNSSTGVAVVTHNLGNTNYMIAVSSFIIAGFASFAFINSRGANSFTIECYANGGLNNCDFDFVVCVAS